MGNGNQRLLNRLQSHRGKEQCLSGYIEQIDHSRSRSTVKSRIHKIQVWTILFWRATKSQNKSWSKIGKHNQRRRQVQNKWNQNGLWWKVKGKCMILLLNCWGMCEGVSINYISVLLAHRLGLAATHYHDGYDVLAHSVTLISDCVNC